MQMAYEPNPILKRLFIEPLKKQTNKQKNRLVSGKIKHRLRLIQILKFVFSIPKTFKSEKCTVYAERIVRLVKSYACKPTGLTKVALPPGVT